MRELADAVLNEGGHVLGVLPRETLGSEKPYELVSELRIAESVCERKLAMESLSDVFIGFPGGVGTLEEVLDVWSRRRMHLHSKPIGLLNIEGYFNKFCEFLQNSEREGFIKSKDRALLRVSAEPDHLVKMLLEEVD